MFRMLVRVVSVGALACLQLGPAHAGPTQEPPALTPDASSSRPVTSPGNAEWASSGDEARTKAAAQKKLVYYEIESQRCDDCRRMHALLYPAADFEALLIGMVPVRLMLDSEEGKRLAAQYSISQAPAVLIATPSGRLVFLMHGFKDATDFYQHARTDLKTYREFAKRIDAQDVATLPAEEAHTTGRQLFARFDYAEARPRFRRASMAPDAKPAMRDSAMEGLAASELQLGQPAQARKSIDQLIATTKNPDMKERAELFRAQIPLAENRPAEALELYKRFEKDHPKSKYLEQVRALIARLEPGEPQK
jgi:anthranilate/para-aminobenzoate synthase component I